MPKPWPNGLQQPGILDDPLDRPEVQLASARALLDRVVEAVETYGDRAAIHAMRDVLKGAKR
jgi:hypothetical protein